MEVKMKHILTAILLMSLLCGTASAWLSGYDHRAEVPINNTGDILTYYQYNFTMDTATEIAIGNMSYADGRDCRMTDVSDNLLSFWNETAFNESDTKIWVNATSLGNVSNTTHYMYYGKTDAVSVVNISATAYNLGDDFSGGSSLSQLWNFTNNATYQPNIPFGLYDYDGDGVDEMYSVNGNYGHLYVFDWGGNVLRDENLSSILHDWGGHPEYRYTIGLDVADIDGDGKGEIVFTESTQNYATAPSYLHCVRLNDSAGFVELWVKTLTGKYECSAVKIGNLTATSGMEAVTSAGTSSADSMVTFCFDKDGNEEWNHAWGNMAEAQAIEIGDFGGNDDNDVVIGTNGGNFRVLYGNNGTELWTATTGDAETFSIKDINDDGKDDILYGAALAFEVWWGNNGTKYWGQACAGDAEWVNWSPEKIDLGGGEEWLAISTGKHQHIYIQHQNGTNYKNIDIGANSWSGLFFKYGDEWRVAVGSDDANYQLKTYDLDLNELASVNNAGMIRAMEYRDNKFFIATNGNPFHWAIYDYVERDYNLTDIWDLRNTPTVSNGVLECETDEFVVSKTAYDIRGACLEARFNIQSGNAKQGFLIGDVKDVGVTNPFSSSGQDGYLIHRSDLRMLLRPIVDGTLTNPCENATYFTGYTGSNWHHFAFQINPSSPYDTHFWVKKSAWDDYHNENWHDSNYIMYIYLGVDVTSDTLTSNYDWVFMRKYASPEPISSVGTVEAPPAAYNTITLGAYQHGLLRKNVTAAETFSTIAAGIDHDRCYTWWDNTNDTWKSYRVGYSYNAGLSIPQNDSCFVLMDGTGTTISCGIAPAGTITIPAGWYTTYLRESTNKTLTSIKADMGGNVVDLFAFDSSAGAWTDTGAYVVDPNDGVLINASTEFNWDGAVP